MIRTSGLLIAIHLFSCLMAGQESIVVESKSVLRKAPSHRSGAVTTVTSGEELEVIRFASPWYLVKIDGRTGWIHERRVSVVMLSAPTVTMRRFRRESDGPAATSKPVTDKPSPFSSEPIDSADVVIYVKNDTGRDINLEFGRVLYSIPKDSERTINTSPGNYEFDVSAEDGKKTVDAVERSSIVATLRSRMRDVKSFEKGRKYSWNIRVAKWYQTEQ